MRIPTGGNRFILSPRAIYGRFWCDSKADSEQKRVWMEEECSDISVFLCALKIRALIFLKKEGFMMKTSKTRMYVAIGIFSAIAFVLQVIGSVMGLKVAGFLEIEISDLPALVMTFAYGPIAGVFTEFIKNLLHCSMTSTGFVGELANFVMNGTLCAVAGLIYRYNKTRKGAVIALVCATVAMAIAGILANLFIMLPLYMPSAPFGVKLNLVLGTILPFNLVRGIALSVITFFIYKKLSPILHKA